MSKSASLVIGLVSDTHLPYRLKRLPDSLSDALAGVDLILHAGDVDEPAELEPLRAIAPVHAVRGNFHILELSDGGAALPAALELHLAGKRLALTHGHYPGLVGLLRKAGHIASLWLNLLDRAFINRRTARYLAKLYPSADVIVFGHTHRAHVEWIGARLVVNPGAVCPTPGEQASIARLRLGDGPPQVEVAPLVAVQ